MFPPITTWAQKSGQKSHPIPYPEKECLSRSAILANLASSNKQPSKVKSAFKSRDYVTNS